MTTLPRPRTLWATLLTVAAMAALGAGLAWACTPQAFVSGVDPGVAAPGQVVRMSGGAFEPQETVRIRWQNASGPLLASVRTDNAGGFTASVTVPADAPEGTALLVAVPVTNPQFARSTALTVAHGQDPTPGGGAGGEPGSDPASPQQAGSDAQPGASGETAAGSPRPGTTGRPVTSQRTPGTARRTAPSAQRDAPATSRRSAPARSIPARSAPADRAAPAAVVRTAAGQTAFAGSVAGRAPAGVTTTKPAAPSDAGAPGRSLTAQPPSEATAGGELWEGFASGSARPSLSDVSGPAESPSSALTLGMALVGLALVGLFAAVGVTEVRRRRVLLGRSDARRDG